MLSKKTLIMASPIAMDVEANPNFPGIASQIIPALNVLNTATHTTFQYTRENAIEAIAEHCGGDSHHHQVTQEISQRTANGIRNGLQQIQHYLKPFAADVSKRLDEWSEGYQHDLVRRVFNNVNIEYVELDAPLLNMSIFPTEIANPNLDYESYEAKKIHFLKDHMSDIPEAELKEIMQSGHEELNALLEDASLNEIYTLVFRGGLGKLLGSEGYNHETNRYNFTKTFGCQLNDLFIGYLMAKRFLVNDDVLKYANGISLEALHEGFRAISFVLEKVLLTAKERFAIYLPRGVVILSDNVERRIERTGIVARGRIVVGVTTQAIERLEQENISVSELVMGHVLNTGDRSNLPSMLNESAYYINAYKSVMEKFSENNAEDASKFVRRQVTEAIDAFQKRHHEFNDGVMRIANNDTAVRLHHLMEPHVDAFVQDFALRVAGQGLDVETFVSNSAIIPALAKTIGLTFAARILELATVTSSERLDERGRRERLAEAVIQATVEVYLNRFS